jgi:PAS domain S-box-containing protein
MARTLDQALNERFNDIHILATLDSIKDPRASLNSKRALLEKLQEGFPEYAWIGVTDLKGKVLVSTKGMLEGADVSKRPWFSQGLKAPWLGDVHDAVLLAKLLPNIDNEPKRFYDVTAPLVDEKGVTVGVIGAHVSWSWAKTVRDQILANAKNLGPTELFIVGRGGEVLLAREGSAEEAKAIFTTFNSLSPKTSGSIDFVSPGSAGKEYLVGAAKTGTDANRPSLEWNIFMRQPLEIALAPAVLQEQRILMLGGCLGLFFAIVAGSLGNRFIRPFGDLAQAARRFKEGKDPDWPVFDTVGYNSIEEAADLSFALKDLLQSVEAQRGQLLRFNESLQSQVEERTQALLLANQKLKSSELQVRSIMQTAIDAIIATDETGAIISWNQGAAAIFGYSEEEVIGKSVNLIVPERFRAMHDAGMKRVVQSGESRLVGQRLELPGLKRDGTEFPTELSLASWTSGDRRYFTAVLRDITERKRTEKALIAAREQAESAAAAKSQFLAQMSHEIRTPLNGVIGMTHMLMDTPLNETQKEYARIVLDSSEGLLGIINDVLDFSKVDAGKMELEAVRFEPVRLMHDTEKAFLVTASKKGITLKTVWQTENQDALLGDPGRIRQVLTNLLGNAIKFTTVGGVTLRASIKKSTDSKIARLRIEVSDTGIGMSKESLARMFQAFSQADSSMSRKYGGTGLGLSISKKLVELMKGEIGVESEEGKGSTFWFELPLPLAPVIQTKAPEEQLITVGSRAARILVAEDNTVNLRIALSMLQKAGYKPQGVGNGKEVLAALATTQYDLILMDCQMPELDGYAATRQIRATDSAYKQIPIIAMTANAVQGSEEECLAAGMNAYVSKPVKLHELVRMIELHLPASGTTGAA